MTTQELINGRKRVIEKQIRGYDATFKLKGPTSLYYILQSLDADTSLEYEDIEHKVRMVLASALMTAQRKANRRAVNFLSDTHSQLEILATFKSYLALNKTIFVVTENSLAKYDEETPRDDTVRYNELNALSTMIGENFEAIIQYGDMLYHIVQGDNDEVDNDSLKIAVCHGDEIPEAAYTYVIDTFPHEEDDFVHRERNLSIVCSNSKCPYHKAALGPTYNDGSRQVACSHEDCAKCSAFNTVLNPDKAVTLCQAVAHAYVNNKLNKSSKTVSIVNKPEYGQLPLPESDENVIIYVDSIIDNESVTKCVVKVYDENYIAGTHASPREHNRSAHMRTNPRTGKKDITVKATTVNKGHSKTTYEVRVHSKRKVKDEPEITPKGQEMIYELLNL